VASPVLTMVHSPGSLFTDAIRVELPVNNRINEWYAAHRLAGVLSVLEGRRAEHSEQAHPKDQARLHRGDIVMHTSTAVGELVSSYGEMLPHAEAHAGADAGVSINPDVKADALEATIQAFIDLHRGPGNSRSSSSNGRRAAAEDGTMTYTELLLHWFNSKTLTWLPVRRGAVTGRSMVSQLPQDVLNNPSFSGKVANLLVTTTDPPPLPECGEFKDLIAGRPVLAIFICM
jgi:hypothetical protein